MCFIRKDHALCYSCKHGKGMNLDFHRYANFKGDSDFLMFSEGDVKWKTE